MGGKTTTTATKTDRRVSHSPAKEEWVHYNMDIESCSTMIFIMGSHVEGVWVNKDILSVDTWCLCIYASFFVWRDMQNL